MLHPCSCLVVLVLPPFGGPRLVRVRSSHHTSGVCLHLRGGVSSNGKRD